MNLRKTFDAVVSALQNRRDDQLFNLSVQLILEPMSLKKRWFVVSFSKSERKPTAHILRPYEVPEPKDELLLQRGPIHFLKTPPKKTTHLIVTSLQKLGGARLAKLFPNGALYIPIPTSTVVSLGNKPVGAILCETKRNHVVDIGRCTVAQIACSIALGRMEMIEVDRRMAEEDFLSLVKAVEKSHSPREACAKVLEYLNSIIPYESGVLYLLDPNPGRNEYLIYGASINEKSERLYKSFFPREALGFTWKVAISRTPKAGSLEDVPSDAKRTNDPALVHLKAVHNAWAVIPFIYKGMTRAVAHIEGVHFGEGASVADLEIMRRLSINAGKILDQYLRDKNDYSHRRASIQLVEKLHKVRDLVGNDKHSGLENFVRHLFNITDGVQQIHVVDKKQTLPQIDGLFKVYYKAEMFIVEVKAPENDDTSLGVKAVRQLGHQMESIGVSTGFLVTSGRFRARTADTVRRKGKILIIDGSRLERLCTISPDDRSEEIQRWLNLQRKGAWLVEIR